jgi:hypothetical protein
MGTVRGLKNRLCPRCRALTPHRTLYAKTESGGKAKWLQLFWACEACNSLNHVILSSYGTASPSPPLPSSLAEAVVGALRVHQLDFEELLEGLRREGVKGVPHLFNTDLVMVLEFLKRRGIVAEEVVDRTERTLETLKSAAGRSVHLGACPADRSSRLVSLYSKKLQKLVPVGVFCVSCGYHKIEL